MANGLARGLLLLSCLLSSATAAAATDSCQTVRLFDPGGSVEGLPVTHQRSTGDCFAHVAALISSAHIRSSGKGAGHSTSPEALYDEVKSSPDRSRLLSANTGRTCNALGLLEKSGSCDRDAVFKALNFGVETDYNELAKSIEDQYSALGLAPGRAVTEYEKAAAAVCEWLKRAKGAPERVLLAAMDAVRKLEGADPEAFRHVVIQAACDAPGARMRFGIEGVASLPACQRFDFKAASKTPGKIRLRKPKEFEAELHRLLAGGKRALPVGIEYCAGVLTDASSEEFITNRVFDADLEYLNTPERSRNFAKDCVFHASAVVGRERKSDGKCYFIVQNSWGEGCDWYPEGTCENGRVWVEAGRLSRNLLRISHL